MLICLHRRYETLIDGLCSCHYNLQACTLASGIVRSKLRKYPKYNNVSTTYKFRFYLS